MIDKGYFLHESSYVDENVQIGDGTKIWYFCHVQSGAVIGENCSLGQNVNIGNNAIIGNGVKIQNNVSVYEGVVLEDNVFCGPSMVFTNDLTPRVRFPKGHAGYKKTIVHHDATIGANATIVCGHELGEYCTIAAGAVVTKNVKLTAVDTAKAGKITVKVTYEDKVATFDVEVKTKAAIEAFNASVAELLKNNITKADIDAVKKLRADLV